jgi:hypothetical protein
MAAYSWAVLFVPLNCEIQVIVLITFPCDYIKLFCHLEIVILRFRPFYNCHIKTNTVIILTSTSTYFRFLIRSKCQTDRFSCLVIKYHWIPRSDKGVVKDISILPTEFPHTGIYISSNCSTYLPYSRCTDK